jgi:hypothetical protein
MLMRTHPKQGISRVGGRDRWQFYLTRSREERKGKIFYSVYAPSLEESSSVTELRPLRVLRGFAASREKNIRPKSFPMLPAEKRNDSGLDQYLVMRKRPT